VIERACHDGGKRQLQSAAEASSQDPGVRVSATLTIMAAGPKAMYEFSANLFRTLNFSW